MLWTSFLAAVVETMVFFAFFDPAALRLTCSPALFALRPMVYAAGFFLFWLFTLLAAALTAYLLSIRPHERP